MPYYTQNIHIHNFAAWTASTAARTSPKCRFKVEVGSQILSNSSLPDYINDYCDISRAEDFDTRHRELRKELIQLASVKGLEFSHGISAKMINIYFKTIFLRPNILAEAEFKKIHPPIDKVLLEGLAKAANDKNEKRKWKAHSAKGWSNYNSDDYELVISDVKLKCGDYALWSIEEFWQGHQ